MSDALNAEGVLQGRSSSARADGGVFHVRDVLPEVLARYVAAPLAQSSATVVFMGTDSVIEAEPVAC